MKNIPCQLPNPKEFPEKLYMHFAGKIVVCFIILLSGFLALAHYLIGISQMWTISILLIFFIYISIPTKWYMQTIYRFFIGSFIGVICTSLLLYYIGWLIFIESGIYPSVKWIAIGSLILYFSIFIIELYQSRYIIDVLKQSIIKSIAYKADSGSFFSIGDWIKNLRKSSFNSGLGFSMTFGLIVGIPVILVGFFGGNPQVSAKILLNNNQDALLYLVISLSLIAVSIILISIAVKEFIKVIALIQLDD